MSAKLCRYPWLGLHFLTNGELMVCPASQSSPRRGLTGERWSAGTDPQALRNAEVLKKIRREMLAGNLPEEFCSRCLAEERAGLMSSRMKKGITLKRREETLLAATAVDGTLDTAAVPLEQLSLRMNNKCNLQCQMCHPSSSTALYREWLATEGPRFAVGGGKVSLTLKEGAIVAGGADFKWFESLFAAIRGNPAIIAGVDFIHFSGGEPLLEPRHTEFLRFLVEQRRAGAMTLDYTTNLTVLPDEVLELWRNFARVRICVSWDGRRKAQEYIRFPIRQEKFLRNVRRLDEAEGPFELWADTTVSLLNVWDYPLFLREFLESSFRRLNVDPQYEGRRFYPSFHLLRKPDIFSLDLISPSGKIKLERHYEGLLPELARAVKARFPASEDPSPALRGILESIRPQRDGSGVEALRETLRKRDLFRKVDYRDFIPEIDTLIST